MAETIGVLNYRLRFIRSLNRPGKIHDPSTFADCRRCGDPFKPAPDEKRTYCPTCLEMVVAEENAAYERELEETEL